MLKETVQKALNEQMTREFYSAYIYGAIAAEFEAKNLDGFGHWMRTQAQEELNHGVKMFDYVLQAGGKVELGAIEKPPTEFGEPVEVFQEVLDHERKVTAAIHKLVRLARDEDDPATENFLKWFVDEQVEEEATAEGILERLKLVAGHGHGVFMMDRELVNRPAPGGGAE